jgi:argininosuccinate lyase
MRNAALQGFSTATDLADYLVKQGLAFRDAHEAVAHAVKVCTTRQCDLADLTLPELRAATGLTAEQQALITSDVSHCLTLEGSVSARNHIGGTAPNQVLAAVARAKSRLEAD